VISILLESLRWHGTSEGFRLSSVELSSLQIINYLYENRFRWQPRRFSSSSPFSHY